MSVIEPVLATLQTGTQQRFAVEIDKSVGGNIPPIKKDIESFAIKPVVQRRPCQLFYAVASDTLYIHFTLIFLVREVESLTQGH